MLQTAIQEEVTEAALRLTSLLDCRADIPVESSLTDYDLALIWLRLRQDGSDRYLFCTGRVKTFEEFKKIVREKTIWVYAGFSKETGEPCALGLLDDFQGGTAKIHYTFFRNAEALNNKELYAKTFINFLFANRTLDCLVLLTPHSFRHSNALARSVGAEFMGTIPSIIPVLNEKDGTFIFGESNLYKLVSPYYQVGKTRPAKDVINYG